MIRIFGPQVPGALEFEEDFDDVTKILTSGRPRKMLKALHLIQTAGPVASRFAEQLEQLLENPRLRLPSALALCRVNNSTKARQIVLDTVSRADGTDPEPFYALSVIAKDDPNLMPQLLACVETQLTIMAESRGKSDWIQTAINTFTAGDDNKQARDAVSVMINLAWDNIKVQRRLAEAIQSTKNTQHSQYIAMALGFTLYPNREKMTAVFTFMSHLFDKPNAAMLGSRNKVRDDAIQGGHLLAALLTANEGLTDVRSLFQSQSHTFAKLTPEQEANHRQAGLVFGFLFGPLVFTAGIVSSIANHFHSRNLEDEATAVPIVAVFLFYLLGSMFTPVWVAAYASGGPTNRFKTWLRNVSLTPVVKERVMLMICIIGMLLCASFALFSLFGAYLVVFPKAHQEELVFRIVFGCFCVSGVILGYIGIDACRIPMTRALRKIKRLKRTPNSNTNAIKSAQV